jgi:hypothetical protein
MLLRGFESMIGTSVINDKYLNLIDTLDVLGEILKRDRKRLFLIISTGLKVF